VRDDELYLYGGAHVRYEIEMCASAAHLLLAFTPERNSLTNALLESYALHLRNLIEFIYWTPKPPDDVNAVHYVRDKDAWLAARGEASDFLKGVKLRADKQIAHLTKKRFIGDAPEKQWDPIAEIRALAWPETFPRSWQARAAARQRSGGDRAPRRAGHAERRGLMARRGDGIYQRLEGLGKEGT